jgi:hypothetical protein
VLSPLPAAIIAGRQQSAAEDPIEDLPESVTAPSEEKRICDAISNETGRSTILLDAAIVVEKLNRMMKGRTILSGSGQ